MLNINSTNFMILWKRGGGSKNVAQKDILHVTAEIVAQKVILHVTADIHSFISIQP